MTRSRCGSIRTVVRISIAAQRGLGSGICGVREAWVFCTPERGLRTYVRTYVGVLRGLGVEWSWGGVGVSMYIYIPTRTPSISGGAIGSKWSRTIAQHERGLHSRRRSGHGSRVMGAVRVPQSVSKMASRLTLRYIRTYVRTCVHTCVRDKRTCT